MVLLIIGLFLILMGLAIHVLKLYFLIAGFNTMPKDKKENVDTKGLGRLMGIYSYANGAVFIGAGLLDLQGHNVKIEILIAFTILSTIYLLIKAQKFDGNIYDEKGKIKEEGKKQINKSLVVTLITIIFVAGLMFYSTRPTKVDFLDQGFKIHGMYGDLYSWESINDIDLLEQMPSIGRKTNGSAVGSNYKGYFMLGELGKAKLHINTNYPPFIYLDTSEGIIIFNMETAEETRDVFEQLIERTNNN